MRITRHAVPGVGVYRNSTVSQAPRVDQVAWRRDLEVGAVEEQNKENETLVVISSLSLLPQLY